MTQPATTTNTPSAGKVILIIVGVLMLLGMLASAGASESKPTTKTRSAWCQTHAGDQWNGKFDSVMERYLDECT